jgi:hypothetical protein
MLHPTTDGAVIKSISENVVVNPGDEAKLSCAVDGKFCYIFNPSNSFFVLSHIHWVFHYFNGEKLLVARCGDSLVLTVGLTA